MKILSSIMLVALLGIAAAGMSIDAFNRTEGNELYRDQAYRQVLSIAESKAERVSDFIDERKRDASFLSETDDVISIFDVELDHNVELMQRKIKRISEKTALDVEKYILEHPNMDIGDLQNDHDFQAIAVQRVGNTGYTAIHNNFGINYFHSNPELIGFDLHNLAEEYTKFWAILEESLSQESFGFYDWKDANGVLRSKYMHCMPIANNEMIVCATTYIDEYGGSVELISDLNSELIHFRNEKGYDDLILINLNGDVIWTAEKNNELGTNLVTGIYNDSLLAGIFERAKSNLEISVSDSKIYGTEGKLSLFVTAPVFNEMGEFIGIVALNMDNDRIIELVKTNIDLGYAGEVYIVNRDFQHITPLKFDDLTGMAYHRHAIYSERINACIEDHDNYYAALRGEYFVNTERFGTYLDYYDKDPHKVLGAHSYILGSGWCVIAEMDENYFLDIVPNMYRILLYALSSLVLFIIISLLILDALFRVSREADRG